jgi:hypothetical protein
MHPQTRFLSSRTSTREDAKDDHRLPSRNSKACYFAAPGYLMCTPEMAREIIRRWISEVPSKIV